MTDPVQMSIVEHFQTLEDPRSERTKKHCILDILVIALCTLLTQGNRILSCSGEHRQQVVFVETT